MSRNHIMFGEISAWFFKALGGIKPDPENPGFKNILLKPYFVNDLENFQSRFEGPYGWILSSWRKKEDKVIYKVTVPPNSTAKLSFKGKKILKEDGIRFSKNNNDAFEAHLKSGNYLFEIKVK